MSGYLVAPHPDDELLGAYRLLLTGEVNVIALCMRNTEDRAGASLELGQDLGYEVEIRPWKDTAEYWMSLVEYVRSLQGTLWVPSPYDAHPDHRLVSSLALVRPQVRFYAVLPWGIAYEDPAQRVDLDTYEWNEKQCLFAEYFPEEHEKYVQLLGKVGPVEYDMRDPTCTRTLTPVPQWEPG